MKCVPFSACKLVVCACALVSVISVAFQIHASETPGPEEWWDLAEGVAGVIRLDRRLGSTPLSEEDTATLRQWYSKFEKVSCSLPADAQGMKYFYFALYYSALRDFDNVEAHVDQAVQAGFNAAEATNLQLCMCDGKSDEDRRELQSRLVSYLPLGVYQDMLDSELEMEMKEKCTGSTEPYGAEGVLGLRIPESPGNLEYISRLYESMNLPDEAAECYVLALHIGGDTPEMYPVLNAQTDHTARDWEKYGDLLKTGGHGAQALNAYFRALVWCGPANVSKLVKDKILEKFCSLVASNGTVTEPRPAVKYDQETIEKIVKQFRECHLHPRAIAFLENCKRDKQGDYSRLRGELHREWAELLQTYTWQGRRKYRFLFGEHIAEDMIQHHFDEAKRLETE